MRESIQSTSFSALPAGNPAQEMLPASGIAGKKPLADGDIDFAASLISARPELTGEPTDDGSLRGAGQGANADPRFIVEVDAGSAAVPPAHNDRGLNHTGFTSALAASGRFTGGQKLSTKSEPATANAQASAASHRAKSGSLPDPAARVSQEADMIAPRDEPVDEDAGKVRYKRQTETPSHASHPSAAAEAGGQSVDHGPHTRTTPQSSDPAATNAPHAAVTGAQSGERTTGQPAVADTGNETPATGRKTRTDAAGQPGTGALPTSQNPSDDATATDGTDAQPDSGGFEGPVHQTQRPGVTNQPAMRSTTSEADTTSRVSATNDTSQTAELQDTNSSGAGTAPGQQVIAAQPVSSQFAPHKTAGVSPLARTAHNGKDTGTEAPRAVASATTTTSAQLQPASPDLDTAASAEQVVATARPVKRAIVPNSGKQSEEAGPVKDKTDADTVMVATDPGKASPPPADDVAQSATVSLSSAGSTAGLNRDPESINRPGETPAELPAIDQPLDPENVDDAFQQALGDRLITAVRQDMNRAEIRITPTELGPITIELSVDGDAASVVFSADQNNTRAALQDSLQSLREHLRNEGISLTEASVSDNASSRPGTEERDANGDERHGDQSLANDSTGDRPANAAPYRPPVREQGLVDLFA